MSAPPLVTPRHSDLADVRRCLPDLLNRPTTVITPIAAGLSDAGVFRVDVGDQHFVLKITPPDEPLAGWRHQLQVQRAAGALGIAPAVVHIDEDRRAVLSALVADQSWAAYFGNPATRDAAIAALGLLLRTRRELPIPPGLEAADPRRVLHDLWRALLADCTLPTFVRDAVDALDAEVPPAPIASRVMSHNDVNPSNLVFDGTRVLLLDWQTAAPNDPLYDVAAVAMFCRMDEATCRQLLAAHDDAPVATLPDAFRYYRRCAAVISGVAALRAARARGHAGSAVAVDATPSLGEVYQQLRSGTGEIRSLTGQWTFGLALVKESALGIRVGR